MDYRSFRALVSKPCFELVLCAGLWSTLGCGEDLKPFTVVDRLRVAAIANEPVRPQPGAPVTVRLLSLREPGDETPLSVFMSGCVLTGPFRACGPGSVPLQPVALPAFDIEKEGEMPTGGRVDTWTFAWPQGVTGSGLIDALVLNCDVPGDADVQALQSKLQELLEKGETPAPEGWNCAENPLRLSRSVWIARHAIDAPLTEGEPLQNLQPAVPEIRKAEDQAELEPGIVRTFISAQTEGVVLEDEPRWSWFTTSPQGVVMRVSAAQGGETKALIAATRPEDYSYWVIVRDNAGRVGWNRYHLPSDLSFDP